MPCAAAPCAAMVNAAANGSMPPNVPPIVSRLRMDERPRIFQVLGADGCSRPKSQRPDRTGRIVTGVLRKCSRALDKEIGHVPALQITVERAVAGIVAHDGAAAEMRRLVLSDIVRPL